MAKPKLKRGTPEYREAMRERGRKGGNATKRKMALVNPDYYSNIGYQGGQSIKRTRGKEYYSEIGKIGSKKQWGDKEAQS